MSQWGYTPLDTPVCFQRKQQAVLWVTQRFMSYSKVGTLFLNGSKFVFWAYQNHLPLSRWSLQNESNRFLYCQFDFSLCFIQ